MAGASDTSTSWSPARDTVGIATTSKARTPHLIESSRRPTDRALSCRPPVNVPGIARRPPGESTPQPGGGRLEAPAGRAVAARQLQGLVVRRAYAAPYSKT